MPSHEELGPIVFARRRAGRFGAIVCVLLAVCCVLPALLVLFTPTENQDPVSTAVGFFIAAAVFILAAVRFATTGIWFHQNGVRKRGLFMSSAWFYRNISDIKTEEFTTTVNGADAGYSVIVTFNASGKRRKIALLGAKRDPDTDAILNLMKTTTGPT